MNIEKIFYTLNYLFNKTTFYYNVISHYVWQVVLFILYYTIKISQSVLDFISRNFIVAIFYIVTITLLWWLYNQLSNTLIVKGKNFIVIDGDTIYIHKSNKVNKKYHKIKIRLYGIDAPESDQQFGYESTQALKKMIAKKKIRVKIIDKDLYGRYVGIIYRYGFIDINYKMVVKGYAIWYSQYAKGNKKYEKAQNKAKRKKRGIWKSKTFIEPKEHRKKNYKEF